jgi:hypothetical protein
MPRLGRFRGSHRHPHSDAFAVRRRIEPIRGPEIRRPHPRMNGVEALIGIGGAERGDRESTSPAVGFQQDGELEMSSTLPVKIADSERSDRRAGSNYLSGVLL